MTNKARIHSNAIQITVPWRCPWARLGPINAVSRRAYRGVNRLLLDMTSFEHGYSSHEWITFAGAKRLGGHVRKGESGTLVIYYERVPRLTQQEHRPSWDREVDVNWIYLCRHFWLFNLDQCAGLDALREPSRQHLALGEPGQRCEQLLIDCGADIRFGGERACYDPKHDVIELPARESFVNESGWMATTLHELTHWTGAAHRLGRDLSARFGTQAYAAHPIL